MEGQKIYYVKSDEYREDASMWLVLADSPEEARDKVIALEEKLGIINRIYLLEDIQEVNFETGIYALL